jgi:hypothetical protein
MFDEVLAEFIESPVMQIVGSAGLARRPGIGRGVGAWISSERDLVHVVISSWQWPDTVTNLQANDRIAVTFSRPADYVSYQIKGRARLRLAEPDEVDRSIVRPAIWSQWFPP